MKSSYHIEVIISQQILALFKYGQLIRSYRISTAKNGVGELMGSECTPRGRHVIRAKIGDGCEANTVFVGRRPTGEFYSDTLRSQFPQRDWILTRIMWLCGTEVGKNRFGEVDTMHRYVYIHGCPDDDEMGVPTSHGCIKMRNVDVMELFDTVPAGTTVLINET